MIIAWIGIAFAGMLAGSFAVPSKALKNIHWDQAWLVFCVLAQIVLPMGLLLLFGPRIFAGLFMDHPGDVAKVLLGGIGWGAGAFLFGLSIPRLGFALANALVCGTVALVGSVSPLLLDVTAIDARAKLPLSIGLALLVCGIALCARASVLRDRAKGAATGSPSRVGIAASLVGVGVAILSGVLSSLINTSFAFGLPLISEAARRGVPAIAASLAVWVPALFGGFLINGLLAGLKISQTSTWHLYRSATARDWLLAASMGAVWFGALVFYGLSGPALGPAGTVYGWAVYMGVSILVATVWGLFTGEWRNAGRASRFWLLGSVAVFLLSFVFLALCSKA